MSPLCGHILLLILSPSLCVSSGYVSPI